MATSISKDCVACDCKLPEADGHDKCLVCLGEAHGAKTCLVCAALTPQARKSREKALKALFLERALFPAPSTSGSRTPRQGKPAEHRKLTSLPAASLAPKRARSTPPALPIPQKTSVAAAESHKGKKKRAAFEARSAAMPMVLMSPEGIRLLAPPTTSGQEHGGKARIMPPTQASPAPVMGVALLPEVETAHPPGEELLPPTLPAGMGESRGARKKAAEPTAGQPASGEASVRSTMSPFLTASQPMDPPREEGVLFSPQPSAASFLSHTPLSHSQGFFPSPPQRQTLSTVPMEWSRPFTPRADYVHRSPGGRAYFFGPILVQDQQMPQPTSIPIQVDPVAQSAHQGLSTAIVLALGADIPSHSASESDSDEGKEDVQAVELPVEPETSSFITLMSRLSRALELPVTEANQPLACHLFPEEEQRQAAHSATALPAEPYLLRLATAQDIAPSLIGAVPRRSDALYKTDLTSAQWVAKPPRPNSVVTKVMQNKRSAKTHLTPSDKEGRKLEAVGKKVHLGAGLSTRFAHYGAYMAAYQDYLWQKIAPYLEALPQDKSALAKVIQQEGLALAKSQKEMAKDTAEGASRMFAAATVIRRHAWLRASTLSEEGKLLAEDLPVNDKGLFDPETDAKLKEARPGGSPGGEQIWFSPASRYQGKSYPTASYTRKQTPSTNLSDNLHSASGTI
nr:PREDICTED: uncharacterized protein LOC107983310 [Anolis carolinensis]|eukprot:XP_016851921.1 PREDICTED: uncharacterized protein LOC107983310 [Anolis carolinensis]